MKMDNENFLNQRVIVTGGTRGLGRGIAEGFLRGGATVIATYSKNSVAAEKFREENIHYGDRLHLCQFSVSDEGEVEKFFGIMAERYPSLEVLVNNSGIRLDGLLATMKKDDFSSVLDTNLMGTFLMSKQAVLAFLPHRYGRIINISSLSGKMGLAGQANYAASKAGQMALTKSLSKEVAKKGITVNSVAPGFVETELIQDLSETLKKEYLQQIPLRRFARVEEVAAGVLFLASREASYITGTTLEIAGGLGA